MDTADMARHFSDQFQYVGSAFQTGNEIQYFFDGGASCGNGINCAALECKPVILNGDPIQKIDVVFTGSGFPDLNSFDIVILTTTHNLRFHLL